jgi:hypothetical protein
MIMGLLTWVLLGVVVLVVIGLGWGVFFSGLYRGAQVVSENPVVQNATQEATKTAENAANSHLGGTSNVVVVHTERTVYKVKEPVTIVVKNEGNQKVVFSNSAPNVQIKNIDTGKTYDVTITQVNTELEPGQSMTITWDQAENPQSGDYTAVVSTGNGTQIGETTFTIQS